MNISGCNFSETETDRNKTFKKQLVRSESKKDFTSPHSKRSHIRQIWLQDKIEQTKSD